MCILRERVASPNGIAEQLAAEEGRDKKELLGHVAYHVRCLKEADLIEPVGTVPRRGATEHYYRAVELPYLTNKEFAELSLEERLKIDRTVVQMAVADATASVETGKFAERPDHHLCRYPTQLDDQGWRDVRHIYDEALEKVFQIAAESAERLGGEPGIDVRVVSMMFEAA